MSASLSANIRAELARKDITQAELAASFYPPYTVAAIHRRMTGVVEWRAREVQHVAQFLKVPITALLTDTPEGSKDEAS